MMREFNLIIRGDKEPLREFIARFKRALTQRVQIDNSAPLSSPDFLLWADTGALEIRGERAVLLARDGQTVVGEIPLAAQEGEKTQNFGLGPKAALRLDLDPMDAERARRVIAGRNIFSIPYEDNGTAMLAAGTYTADELEAIAWYARESATRIREN